MSVGIFSRPMVQLALLDLTVSDLMEMLGKRQDRINEVTVQSLEQELDHRERAREEVINVIVDTVVRSEAIQLQLN